MNPRYGLVLMAAALAGCTNRHDFTGVVAPPSIGVSMAKTATVQQGKSVQLNATVSRLSGFTGSIDLSMEALPAGVTAVFAPATVPQSSTSSTLTVSATATATLGAAAVFLVGRTSGAVSATMLVTLTVAP